MSTVGANRWGSFSKAFTSYVITDSATPRCWENYLYTKDGMFHAIVGQRGEGTTFYNCLEVNVASRGRNYCVHDRESGCCWSVNGGAAPDRAETYRCTHQLAGSVFEGARDGVAAVLEVVLAVDHYVEVNRIRLGNHSERTRKLSLIGYQLVDLHGLDNRLECQRSRYDAENGVLVCERRHYRTPKYYYAAFFTADRPADSYCGEREAFLGADVPFAESRSLISGVLNNVDAWGEEPILALQHEIELAPGEEKTVNFFFGLGQTLDEAAAAGKACRIPGMAETLIRESEQYFAGIAAASTLETPDEILNVMMNFWVKKQLHRQTVSARSTGWFNWRNHLQDSWAWLLFDPSWLRRWIIMTCGAAEEDGFLPRCSARVPELVYPDQTHADIATWAALCGARYYAETGDVTLFAEKLPNGRTVGDTLARGLEWLYVHKGRNGMALMRAGDWSDPLEEVGKKDIGESPWTSMALVNATAEFAPLLALLGETERARTLQLEAERMIAAINAAAWDGDWYIRAITDSGERLCCAGDPDGRVSLLVQAWAIISGVAPAERVRKLVAAVDANNMTAIGPELYAPPFLEPRPWIGRETAKPAGTCVNGACYSHVAMMWAMANAMLGRPDESLRIIHRLLPLRETDETAITRCIPLWVPSYYHGVYSKSPGRASDVMTTAAPPWMFLVVFEHLFGIRATPEGLRIRPNLPSSWGRAVVTRSWRGSEYRIEMVRKIGVSGTRITVDGIGCDTGVIAPDATPGHHDVLVEFSGDTGDGCRKGQ